MLQTLTYREFQNWSWSATLLWFALVLSAISCNRVSREDSTASSTPAYPEQDIIIIADKTFNIDPDSLEVKSAQTRTVKAGQPEEIPYTGIKRVKAGDPNIIEIDTSRLKVITPGTGSIPEPRVYVLSGPTTNGINTQRLKGQCTIQYGNTLYAPVISKVRPSEPVQALPMSNTDNAVCRIQYLDLHHGLRNAEVLSLMEDRQGNIWFGCDGNGICRYDGKFLNFYANREGLWYDYVIWELLEDSKGNIWITGNGGISKFDGHTFIHYFLYGLSFKPITSIIETKNGDIWIGSSKGLLKFDGIHWTQYTENEGLPDNLVLKLFEDTRGNIWIRSANGISRFDGRSFTNYIENKPLLGTSYGAFIEDRNGTIWTGSNQGLIRFDGTSLEQYTTDNGLSNNSVISLLEDHSGNIWIGTWGGGLNMYDGSCFTHYTKNEGLPGNIIADIVEDNCHNIWLGSAGGGLIKLQRASFTYFSQLEDLIPSRISSVFEDRSGHIWFGIPGAGALKYNGSSFSLITQETGLYSAGLSSMTEDITGNIWFGFESRGLQKYDGKSFTLYLEEEGSNVFHAPFLVGDPGGSNFLLAGTGGNIWQGSMWEGLKKFDGKSFTRFPALTRIDKVVDYHPGAEFIRYVLQDKKGDLWIAAVGDGMSQFFKYDGNSVTKYIHKSDVQNLGMDALLEDKSGNLWIGTRNGVIKLKGGSYTRYSEEDGLCNNYICSAIEDHKGNIWIGTMNGLSALSPLPDGGYFITSFGKDDGLKELQFNSNCVAIDRQNRIWWGTEDRITMLDLDQFELIPQKPRIQMQNLYLAKNYLDYRSPLYRKDESNRARITFTDVAPFFNYPRDPELPHNMNHLTFSYSAIDWTGPEKLRYKYLLEGLDEFWSPLSKDNFADYRSVPPGKYIFMVKAIGQAGIWSDTFEYPFTIRRPLWFRWWSVTLYIIAIVTLTWLYIRYMIGRVRIEAEMKIKQAEVDKMREMDRIKSRFFANISHEFRTPLTLLLGPVEDLLKQKPENIKPVQGILHLVRNNALRLQRLINQLLDLSKLETGNIRLNVSEGDLALFLKRIVLSFLSLAESRHISYDYDLPDTSMSLFFDGDKLEKILTNLISNAFKFTPEGGQINVILRYIYHDDKDLPLNVELTVRDTGKGIPDNQIDKIFDRFYQVSSSDTREEEGSGIGLSLTKELVEVYRGEIKVESAPGRGSTFTVRLPVARGQFREEEIVPAPDKTPVRTITEEPVTGVPGPEVPERLEAQAAGKDREIVLIVEDNYDLRKYIARNLEPFFQVMESENGRTGLEKAVDIIPDMLITDLMMPEMDGMELCKNMKKNERTCHIPIVVLTAKADRDSKLNCLESGADDFIIKPFDMQELQVRVRNLILQRKKLREKFNRDLLADPSAGPVRSPDDQLFEKILNCFNQHIDDTGFNTDQMAGELSLSRAQLFRKIQALTGHSPNDLLNRIRLRKAAMLFREGHSNIGQVMYAVGFNTPSYFAKCFKEHYGLIPSEYIRRPG